MLDKNTVSTIQGEISAALGAIAKKHNLTMSGTAVRYSSTSFKLTASFGDKESTGGLDIDPIVLRNLQRNGFMYGLSGDMAGKEFLLPGRGRCQLHGMRGKFAIVKELSNSKMWRYEAEMIAAFIKAEKQ